MSRTMKIYLCLQNFKKIGNEGNTTNYAVVYRQYLMYGKGLSLGSFSKEENYNNYGKFHFYPMKSFWG